MVLRNLFAERRFGASLASRENEVCGIVHAGMLAGMVSNRNDGIQLLNIVGKSSSTRSINAET